MVAGLRSVPRLGPAAPLGEPQQQRGELVAARRVTGDDQHRVVAGDGAEHRGQAPVDHRGQQLRGARRRAQHDQVAAGLGRHQQLARHPGQAAAAAVGVPAAPGQAGDCRGGLAETTSSTSPTGLGRVGRRA